MKLTRSEFFEQATEHLLSSLNLQQGLISLRAFLSGLMPVQSIRLMSYPIISQGEERVLIVRSTEREDITFLAKKLGDMEKVKLLLPGPNDKGLLVTDPEHPLAVWYTYRRKLEREVPPLPWYVLSLWVDGRFLGECQFACTPGRVLTEEQCRLLDTLQPLFRLALHNYQQYVQIQEDRESMKQENKLLREKIEGHGEQASVIGAQGGLRHVMDRLRMLAFYNIPVLITGETGTGKEVIARECHRISPRRSGPFVAVNCGAIPSSLSDSELFGHMKGSFTGALRDHKGYFERANGGTLFLDEIGELPLETQVRLLRVLQERVILPVGGTKPISIDTRIVAATNKDIPAMVREGTFREDLYYRLRVAHILLPPLRERVEDIPLLAHHFAQKFAAKADIVPPIFTNEEIRKLQKYSWPGNVRELENVIVEAIVTTPIGGVLHFNVAEGGKPEKAVEQAAGQMSAGSIDAMVESCYREAYEKCRGRIKGPDGMAAMLGIHPSTLRFRLKKLGILGAKEKA